MINTLPARSTALNGTSNGHHSTNNGHAPFVRTSNSEPSSEQGDCLQLRDGGQLLLPKRKNIVGGLKITRTFSSEDRSPYANVQWERRDIRVTNAKGDVISERLGVEVPAHWDDNAVRMTADKYLFGSKPGSPEFEDSIKLAFDRIANTYTIWGWEEGYFAELSDAAIFNEEIKGMLVQQLWAPNSPVWFNLGHWEQWRWGRPDLRPIFRGKGNKAYFATQRDGQLHAEPAEHAYARPQASACFLSDICDSMESEGTGDLATDGIFDHLRTEGRIFASGSGVGLNLSTLRSSFEPICGKGKSSGPIAFNAGFDRMAGAIKSGGKTRRAARMVLLSADHPDIFAFVTRKKKQEDIAKIILRDHNTAVALRAIAAEKLKTGTPEEKTAANIILALPIANETKYSADMDGHLYGDTLSDQNANHTISCKGAFWQAYYSNGEYATRWVIDPTRIQERYKPDDLLSLMADSVWENGEPGIHNNDYINLWSPVKSDGDITTSNPCSEYLHLNNTSCNLSSFNLYRFFDRQSRTFQAERFSAGVRLAMIAADLNIERGGFPTPQIAIGTYRYRTTGIGYANLGGLLMALGMPYDSDDGRYIAAQITSLLSAAAWSASAELGRELGPYEAFHRTGGDLRRVLRLHQLSQDVLQAVATRAPEAVNAFIQEIGSKCRGELPEAQGLTGVDALHAFANNFVSGTRVGTAAQRFVADAEQRATAMWKAVTDTSCRYRNSFVTAIAPTGTISAPLGCFDEGTLSAEPDYSLRKYKQLSGGGYLTLFNSLALEGLRSLGYTEDLVREAAFEVAGIDGLRVACQNNDAVRRHLQWKPTADEQGPVRKAFLALCPSASEIERILHRLEADRFSSDISEQARLVLSGTSNVEQLPWLRDEHVAAFDCANANGDGKRAISVNGHINMLGALQPFISGAVSKTVNLRAAATREDIKKSYVQAHTCGVKCIAIFRDDSKANAVFATETPATRKRKPAVIWETLVASTRETMKDIVAEASKPRQRRLPGRRLAQTVKFSIGGQLSGFITVGVYPDGTCGEIFGRLGQVGSFASSMFEAKCKEMSQSLQWGVPLGDIIASNRGMAFQPDGFCKVGDDSDSGLCPDIKSCASVVDLVAKVLEWLFPADTGYRLRDLVNAPSRPISTEPVTPLISVVPESQTKERVSSNAASLCPRCQSLAYVQDGHCKSCRNCGFKDGGCGE